MTPGGIIGEVLSEAAKHPAEVISGVEAIVDAIMDRHPELRRDPMVAAGRATMAARARALEALRRATANGDVPGDGTPQPPDEDPTD